MTRTFQATVERIAMAGGCGTSYRVYVSVAQKGWIPLYGLQYATTTHLSGEPFDEEHSYLRLRDFLVRKCDLRERETFSQAWMDRIREVDELSRSLELDIMHRAFPETMVLDRVPTLWATTIHEPSAKVQVPFEADIDEPVTETA